MLFFMPNNSKLCYLLLTDTLELFLPTLELQAIYLNQEKDEEVNTVCVVFRPSWDPEHGLAILLNLDSKEVKLYED